ncbi:hypothetical protein ET495_10770 [Xylanimonas allomyrinae]|uniref:DNA modification methylase n=1 Tax=Xylanimonas allomyrinae TaxID=2509459 RepID=A0A4P6F001_9MICO|nr:hypothetical protein [Xylanimonas allomyrinae]QAY63648.1 hypothetical protein ET495_10770 [Xylanimonas allomyrinae]
MSRTRHARPAALVTAAVAALTLGACAPTMTATPYSPSDGTRVDVSDALRGVNLLVVAAEEGGEGAVQGALVNRTDGPLTFTLTVDGASPVRVPVPAAQTVTLGTDDGVDVVLDAVAKAPGSYLTATLEVAGTSQDFQLPVLDGTLPEYAGSLPRA